MSTITQKFSVGLGGIAFVSSNEIEANSASTINDYLTVSNTTTTDYPIYAEGDGAGDIRLIAVEFASAISVCQFLDSSNSVVFDAVSANGGSNLNGNQSYIFPGNAALTISGTNDITKVRLQSGVGSGLLFSKIGIAYEMSSSDTIS